MYFASLWPELLSKTQSHFVYTPCTFYQMEQKYIADIHLPLPLRFIATLRGHVSMVYQVAWSADSRMLVSSSKDSTLKVWKDNKIMLDLPGHSDEVRI